MKYKSAGIPRNAIAIAVSLLISSVAYGQSAEGTINGKGKAGEKVTIVSTETGSSRVVTIDNAGNFNVSKMPPGTYKVTSGGVTKEITVAIGSGTNVVMTSNDAPQRIVVSGRRVVIDMNSTETSTVFSADQMAALPVAKDPNSVALLAPGVTKGDSNLGAGNLPSFGGASVAENGYYINGFDVTNIRNFLSYANLPFDAIGSQQIKSGGYGAEYGRSLGGIISLSTKRGTNQWKGGSSVYWNPNALVNSRKNVKNRDIDPATGYPDQIYLTHNTGRTYDAITANAYIGGPIIKDKLFVYGLVTADRWSGNSYGLYNSNNSKGGKPNGMIKLDFTPSDMHRFELTAISNKEESDFYSYSHPKIKDASGALVSDKQYNYVTRHVGDKVTQNIESGGNVLIGKYTAYVTDNLTVSGLVGKVDHLLGRVTDSRKSLSCPVVLDESLNEVGCWTGPFPGPSVRDTTAPDDKDERRAYRFDIDYNIGNHNIRAGVDNQRFESTQAGSTPYTGGVYWRYYKGNPTGTVNGVVGAVAPNAGYIRGRTSSSTSGSFQVNNSAFYVEDNWKVNKNLFVSSGLRAETFDNKNAAGVSFIKKERMLAPRLGFAYDVTGAGDTKVYGNLGRYFIPVASNTNIRATRGESFIQRFYGYSSKDPVTQAPIGLTAPIGIPQIVSDGSLPNPATIADINLKPMNQDEVMLGFQRALNKEWTFGVKGIHRRINDGMDDYCSHIGFDNWAKDKGYKNFDSSTMATCMMVNPGNDVTLMIDVNNDGKLVKSTVPASYLGLAKYTRLHNSLEFTLDRPFDGKWGLSGSYVLARTTGTAEGYVNSVINQEDAGITQDFDFGSLTDGSNGRLSNDRRHTIKVFGNYALTDTLRAGFNGSVTSGRPTSCIGFVPSYRPDYSDAQNYTTASSYYCLNSEGKSVLRQRGTAGETPWLATVDFQLAYMPKMSHGKLTVAMDIFNIFNSQRPVETIEVNDYSRETVATGKRNPNYGLPSGFQAPRSVRFTARYEF
jgi:hypothetical protein